MHGRRFMPEYDERAELAPRDVVTRAIVSQMEATQHPCVYLDVSHLDASLVRRRFPGIAAACAKFGIDITREPIPVRPGAHYMIGGVTVDLRGATTLPGLWAAGEATSSGLHGANRLASNSLLEGLVFGAHAGEAASRAALETLGEGRRPWPVESPARAASRESLDWGDIRNSLTSLMWREVGVRREAASLEDAAQTIDRWQRYVLNQAVADRRGWELQNMLTVARLITEAAQRRTESRGVHYRVDFTGTDERRWRCHLAFRRWGAPSVRRRELGLEGTRTD